MYSGLVGDAAPRRPRRILVFGGTFDPPHLAHARLPALAAQQLHCDEILYVPASINPLKGKTKPAPKEHRLAMLLLAIADVPGARISTIELDRKGKSYSIDTLRALSGASSGGRGHTSANRLFLLIGCDQALDFHRWKSWEEIQELATPAVMVRPPWTRPLFARDLRRKYGKDEAERWLSWTLDLPRVDISATEVRRRLRAGQRTDAFLDPAVARYIRTNRLYG
jgi:nicotinate-nucleotide adenylyltransferase